ncbi:MAG: hypothetical protein C0596_10755 [Marinilabiliales bacterium]|nr:MAG: hypothetical protein C0596_10755 [Marinilabiliales bacterium]
MAENKEMDIVGLMINIFAFIRRYIFVVLGFIVLGAGLGAVDYFTGRNYYKTTLVATSPVIDNQIVYELMGPVKYYVVNEMYDSISEKFDVSLDVAKDIKKIELDTSMVQAVKIELDVYNSENVPAIKDGIIFYLNSIPYVTSTIDSRRSELKGYIKDINEEIEDLNVLQDAII